MGNYKGGDLGVNFIFDKKYIVKLGFSATEKLPIVPPTDFLKSAVNDVQKRESSFENFENFYVTIGRVVFLNSKEKVRFLIQGGTGFSNNRKPENWRWRVNDSNESVFQSDININRNFCFILNPKIEVPIAPVMGISVGPMFIYSSETSFFGAGIGLTYGII